MLINFEIHAYVILVDFCLLQFWLRNAVYFVF
jgi:hypothetical protein